jgi:hypothetical protein
VLLRIGSHGVEADFKQNAFPNTVGCFGHTVIAQPDACSPIVWDVVKAIYLRLAMILTMAMPVMKRSALIMASVRYGGPAQWKNTDGSLCRFLKFRGSDPEASERFFDTAGGSPPGIANSANPAGRKVLEQTGIKFPGFSPFRRVGLLDRSVLERREPAYDCQLNVADYSGFPRRWPAAKELRPGFGGSLAAREPVWDGEGWGCDRVA